jgi:hypothetical protein
MAGFKITLRKNGRAVGEMSYGSEAVAVSKATAMIKAAPGTTVTVASTTSNPRRNGAAKASSFTWEKGETPNEWTLLLGGDPVADLVRGYPSRWGGAGKGQVKDTSKPPFWTLVPWGEAASVKACPDGSTVPAAKAAAESIMRGKLKSNPRRNGAAPAPEWDRMRSFKGRGNRNWLTIVGDVLKPGRSISYTISKDSGGPFLLSAERNDYSPTASLDDVPFTTFAAAQAAAEAHAASQGLLTNPRRNGGEGLSASDAALTLARGTTTAMLRKIALSEVAHADADIRRAARIVLTERGERLSPRSNGASAHICRNPNCGCKANPRRNGAAEFAFDSNFASIFTRSGPGAIWRKAAHYKGGAPRSYLAQIAALVADGSMSTGTAALLRKQMRDGGFTEGAEAEFAAYVKKPRRAKRNPRNGTWSAERMAALSQRVQFGRR